MKIPLIIVAGPTASGKTALSVELAKCLDGEIVSADSMQIYKYMNIGTAKPTQEEMGGIVHHMLDFLEPSVNFSAAEYCDMAKEVIGDIAKRKKIPILTGGTGLYIDSLSGGVDFGEDTSDSAIRGELEALAKSEGNTAVYTILEEIDPETALKYHPNNLRRVIRAIEFYKTTGTTISQHAKQKKTSQYDSVYFSINWERQALYDRINKRVDIMVEQGLVSEVKSLLDRGFDKNSTAMQGIGYKEFYPYFDNEKSLDEVVETIKMNSRRYAKRQLTWFRRNKDIHWLNPNADMKKEALDIINNHFDL